MSPQRAVPLCDLRRQHEALKAGIESALARVCARGDFILGREVGEFEQAFANYCGTTHCVGVANGTDALKLALMAAGVGPWGGGRADDEVVVPAFTFVATATAVVQAGARPVLCDVLDGTLCMDPRSLERVLTPRTRAIMPVHLFGRPVDDATVSALAAARGIPVVEDAAQAHGARSRGRRTGSLGLAAGFSFFPAKNLGCYGDGGAVTTKDDAVADKVRLLRNCGRTTKYEHPVQGFNSRLDTLQAAVLIVKLAGLDAFNARRREVAGRYRKALGGLKALRLPDEAAGDEAVYHQFVVRTPHRDGLRQALKSRGIESGIHYPKPIHLQGAFADLGHKAGDFPVSETAAREVLSLPIYPEIPDTDVDYVAEAVRAFFAGASGKAAGD